MNPPLVRFTLSALAGLAMAGLFLPTPAALAQGGPATTVFATTGGGALSAVPGEPVGTTFSNFGAPSIYDPYGLGALVTLQPPPVVSLASANPAPVSAIVRLTPPIISRTNARAIIKSRSGVLVRAGDSVPGVQDAIFAKFGQPVFGGGRGGGAGYGFLATIANGPAATAVTKSTETGLWSDCTGALALLARTGAPAPDAAGTALPGVTFTQFISYVLPILDATTTSNLQRSAGLVFLAKIKGPGITPQNNLGVWFQDSTKSPGADVKLLFRTGDPITMPDQRDIVPIKGLQLFLPSKDMPGQRRSYTADGAIMALATFAKNRSCVIAARPSNDPNFQTNPYGLLENTNVGHPSMPTALSGLFFAMRAKLFRSAPFTQGPGKVTAKNDTVILVGDNQSFFNRQYETGDNVGFVNNATYVDFGDPAASGRGLGDIIFSAKIAGPGIDKTNDSLLYSDFDGNAIARTGDQAVGAPDGVKWKSFVSYAKPEANGQNDPSDFRYLFFLAKVTGTGVSATNDTGLWGRDKNNTLHLLARTGDPLTVAQGDVRTILMIQTLNAVADSAGQGRFVDVLGNITALLTFTDRTTALVRFNLDGASQPN